MSLMSEYKKLKDETARLQTALTEAERVSDGLHAAVLMGSKHTEALERERDDYKALAERRGEALKGCCSRIGDTWHRLGCEAFQRPFGECDQACVEARAAIDGTPMTKCTEALRLLERIDTARHECGDHCNYLAKMGSACEHMDEVLAAIADIPAFLANPPACDAEKAVLVAALRRLTDAADKEFKSTGVGLDITEALSALADTSPAVAALLAQREVLERCQAYIHNVLCSEADEEDCKEEICLAARDVLALGRM